MSDDFPDDVRRLIVDGIDSVEQLEILLLLRGDSQREWSAEAVGQALYTSPQAAELRLAGLCSRNILSFTPDPPRYRYAPSSAEADATIARLGEIYRERRVSVISLIYARPRPLQAFADAFKLRRGT